MDRGLMIVLIWLALAMSLLFDSVASPGGTLFLMLRGVRSTVG